MKQRESQSNTVFHNARIEKDKNFDGIFVFAVRTTGIFCRPSCPAPTAKEENVVYFSTVFEALSKGFRPCYRCRPDIEVEYGTGNVDGAFVVKTALEMIGSGYLNRHGLRDLAGELLVSGRHLRKLFTEHLGAPPVKIARYHRALFAKKLLFFSNSSVTDIAFASGFGSTRQFNAVFQEPFGETPTAARKGWRGEKQVPGNTTLRLNYKKPFDFQRILSFLKPRAIAGVEAVTDNGYARTFWTNQGQGYFTVRDDPEHSALNLSIDCADIRCYMQIHHRVRRMFDLNTDFTAINRRFALDPVLCKGMKDGHVPRLPEAFDPFEAVVRAILGQQISVPAATTLAGRIARRAARESGAGVSAGLDYFFPNPAELLAMDLEGLGITGSRQATLRSAAKSIIQGKVRLTANQPFQRFYRDFSAIRGIGDWTVHYVAMRGLGMIDSFPATDLGIARALAQGNKRPPATEILKRAEPWRPYRAYAALCLWSMEP